MGWTIVKEDVDVGCGQLTVFCVGCRAVEHRKRDSGIRDGLPYIFESRSRCNRSIDR